MPPELTVWRFVDGKPGHENQSRGLLLAMQQSVAVCSRDVPVEPGLKNLTDYLLARCSSRPQRGKPDFLIGAGHATHLPMLACRRACGGKIVVLMKPSLPLGLFDYCIAPEHDGLAPRENLLQTRGVLNTIKPSEHKQHALAVILLGGPSGEYAWDEEQLVQQVEVLVTSDVSRTWQIVGSRRTPGSTIAKLRQLASMQALDVLSAEQTPRGWLAERLAITAEVWVTEDSVSMVYEALTARAACGLLRVPQRKAGRVAGGVEKLLQQGWLTSFDAWQRGQVLSPPNKFFNEAARAATWILQHA